MVGTTFENNGVASDPFDNVSILSSNASPVVGQPVTFTATVAPFVPGRTPTGSVQFQVDGVNVGSPLTLIAGSAQFTMVNLAADDSELAFVAGHEMAHNIAHDAVRKHPLGGLLLQFGFGAARVKQAEINADTMAITLMARAGYELAAPEHLLSKAASSHQLDLAITHPGIARRITVVRQAIAARAVLALAGSQAGSGTDRHAQQGGMTIR